MIYPSLENIERLKVPPTPGEYHLLTFLKDNLDDSYEIFFNPFLDGDRPDIIIMKKGSGVFVIEVKDWDLNLYNIDEKNQWFVTSKIATTRIKSPQSQAFNYKKNLYDLHLPVVGLARLLNPNFYKLVHCFVYFHSTNQEKLKSIYSKANNVNAAQREDVKSAFLNGNLKHGNYEKQNDFLIGKKNQIHRDENMSYSRDMLNRLLSKIRKTSSHILFDDNVYQDFKRRLSPSEHTKKQGVKINLDKKQQDFVVSHKGMEKLKGVAGCGKTTVLAHRGMNAHERHNDTVLILTFNITLKNRIRDMLSDIQGRRNFEGFEISNYHQFFNIQLNETGQDITFLMAKHGIGELYDIDFFNDLSVVKYDTILLDEVQDYKSQWVKIIRDNFLAEHGEMVLYGDDCQNIYGRESGRSKVIAQGFGDWNKLKRSYRISIDSSLNNLFKDFQLKYLVSKYSDIDVNDTHIQQQDMSYSILRYEVLLDLNSFQKAFDLINEIIMLYELHPNDVVILSSKIYPLRRLNELFSNKENTHCMFETYSELAVLLGESESDLQNLNEKELALAISKEKADVDRVRRVKKNHFYANSGHIKISTTHSYKGLESKTVFYLMLEDDEAELVYTSITRTTENLIVLDIGGKNQCSELLPQYLKS